ncbi:MAG: hypothetical protein ACRC7G_11715, partial [Beijerinckiaceae bacterium]
MSKVKMQETMDLAELERQLGAVIASRPAQADDPLLELARMVGQTDQGVGRAADARSSFDDFLASPPRPAGGAMPSSTPPFEPLFPEAVPSKPARSGGPDEVEAEPLPAEMAPKEARPALAGLSEDRREVYASA